MNVFNTKMHEDVNAAMKTSTIKISHAKNNEILESVYSKNLPASLRYMLCSKVILCHVVIHVLL